jgi:hypothetical protein
MVISDVVERRVVCSTEIRAETAKCKELHRNDGEISQPKFNFSGI